MGFGPAATKRKIRTRHRRSSSILSVRRYTPGPAIDRFALDSGDVVRGVDVKTSTLHGLLNPTPTPPVFMTLPRVLCFCAVALPLLSLSCRSSKAEFGVTAIQPADVVVPEGMQLRENLSSSNEAEGWVYAHLVYRGGTPPEAAVADVLERMPLHSWELVQDTLEDAPDERRTLRFQRGRYTATYAFHRDGSVTGMVVDYRTPGQG